MSEIFRQSVLNRLPPPTKAPWALGSNPDDEDEEMEEIMDDDDSRDDIGSLPDLSSTATSRNRRPGRRTNLSYKDLSPISASSYFSQAVEVSPTSSDFVFRAYYSPPTAFKQHKNGAVLVCHHGAGSGGTTFALLAKHVTESSQGELGVLAFDCRGHGKTRLQTAASASFAHPTSTEEEKLSFQNLQQDFIAFISQVYPDPSQAPDLVLTGHSMGASPVISSAPVLQNKKYNVVGVVVLDVVEGTAVEALPLMKEILGRRPTRFDSVEAAIDWHITSGAVRNQESARVSVPSLLVPGPREDVVWRTDLLRTSPYWEEWYKNLSSHFLAARAAKLLVLAGQERLDRELMVGQMQGKFQLVVLPDVGHYLHEDKPERLASILVDFWRRNTTRLVLPPKIGQSAAANLGLAAQVPSEATASTSQTSHDSVNAVQVKLVGEQ